MYSVTLWFYLEKTPRMPCLWSFLVGLQIGGVTSVGKVSAVCCLKPGLLFVLEPGGRTRRIICFRLLWNPVLVEGEGVRECWAVAGGGAKVSLFIFWESLVFLLGGPSALRLEPINGSGGGGGEMSGIENAFSASRGRAPIALLATAKGGEREQSLYVTYSS